MDEKLTDMLLDPESASAKVRAHVAECARCGEELARLQATMNLLDGWEAPEPSSYFLTRLNARMREERAATPSGWAGALARLRARLVYGSSLTVRPLAATALTIALLVGGGAYLGVTDWMHPAQPTGQTAVVHDLQTLDNNAQVLDQMEALSNNENGN
jgi:anti-sigma factor RsiW